MKDYLAECTPAQKQIIAEWIGEKHPELFRLSEDAAAHNVFVIGETFADNGWPLDARSPDQMKSHLEGAYCMALQNGQLRESQEAPPSVGILPPSPIPTLQPDGAIRVGEMTETEYLQTAPLGDVKRYLEKTHGQKPAPNILLPQPASSVLVAHSGKL